MIGYTGGGNYDEENTLEHSDVVLNTHRAGDCHGLTCTIHKRSNHSMRSFPQHWRSDRRIMERICPHGIGHPDPDDYKVQLSKAEQIHGCDGCCREVSDFLADSQESAYNGQWHRDPYGGDK